MSIIKRLFITARPDSLIGKPARPAVTRDEMIRLFAQDLGYACN